MKVDEWTSEDGHTSGGGEYPPCAGLTLSSSFCALGVLAIWAFLVDTPVCELSAETVL